LLTGGDYEEIVNAPRAGKPLVVENGGERMMLTLTNEWRTALADADDQQLASVAVQWSQIEEFQGTNTEGLAP
jgi:hypothetical protein